MNSSSSLKVIYDRFVCMVILIYDLVDGQKKLRKTDTRIFHSKIYPVHTLYDLPNYPKLMSHMGDRHFLE